MPTYSYKCRDCGYSFTIRQSIKEDALKECPECGGEVRRLISGNTGLIFKGSGFYLTDYARKNSSSAGGKNGTKSDKAGKPAGNKKQTAAKTTKTETSHASG